MGYLNLTSATTDYVSAPNIAAYRITGDIDLRAKVALDDWTPTGNAALISTIASATSGYELDVMSDGTLRMFVTRPTNTVVSSSVATGITDGAAQWVRATRTAATGVCNFYLGGTGVSPSWVQLGAADRPGTAGNIVAATQILSVGLRWSGGVSIYPYAGKHYRAQVYDGIAGTLVFDADFTDLTTAEVTAKAFVEDSSNAATVTLNGSAWTYHFNSFDSDVDVTIEFGFGSGPFATSPTWVDVSQYVRGANWQRGRWSVVGDFPAGFGSVQLDNTDGRFYSWNTSSPYTPDVTVGVPIRIQAIHATITYPLFRGYVRSWNNPSPYDEELITVPFVETFTRLNDRRIQTSMVAGDSDVRIGDILDAAGWPAGWRDLDAGVAEVAAITPDESAVFLLRETAQAEQGEVFQDATGNIRFRNRVASSSIGSLATFGPSGSDLTYVDIGVDFDDDYLYNEALVTGATGEQQSASDATSITDHGGVTFQPVVNEAIVDSGAALNVAEWIVGKHKTIGPRITSFVVDPADDPTNLWPQVLGRDLRDVVTVNVDYNGTAVTLSQDVAIESLAQSFDAVSSVWTVTYGCHPLSALEQLDFWILGTSGLDTGTVLA